MGQFKGKALPCPFQETDTQCTLGSKCANSRMKNPTVDCKERNKGKRATVFMTAPQTGAAAPCFMARSEQQVGAGAECHKATAEPWEPKVDHTGQAEGRRVAANGICFKFTQCQRTQDRT